MYTCPRPGIRERAVVSSTLFRTTYVVPDITIDATSFDDLHATP